MRQFPVLLQGVESAGLRAGY